MIRKSLPILALMGASFLHAADDVSNTELLEAIRSLDARLARIEARLDTLESAPAVQASAAVIPENPNLVDRVVGAFASQQEGIRYPWMDADKWSQIAEGMSQDEVLAILGEPTVDEPSLNRRIDNVYTYRGRRVGTGQMIIGKVKFRHDKVVVIELPEL